MTGEPREGRERHEPRDPLPPIVAAAAAADQPDAALTGAPLPPYRPGLHAARLVDDDAGLDMEGKEMPTAGGGSDISPAALWGGSWEAPSEEAEREAVETWDARRAAWDAGPLIPPTDEAAIVTAGGEGTVSGRTEPDSPPAPEVELLAPEFPAAGAWDGGDEEAPIDGAPFGPIDRPAVETGLGAGVSVGEIAYGEEPVGPGIEEEAGFDLGPSGAEDIAGAESPWGEGELEDRYPLEDSQALTPAGWDDSWTGAGLPGALDLPEAAEEETGATSEAQTSESLDEWLVSGVADDFPWDAATAVSAPIPAATEFEQEEEPWEDGAPAGVEAAAAELPAWEAWQPEDDQTAPPSDEDAPAWAMDDVGDEEAGVGVEIESFAAVESIEEAPTGLETSAEPAAIDEGFEPPHDERVARVPQTPLDSWFHSEQAPGATETWEAFGKALEEAASWGDLGSTIATGLTPAEQEAGAAAAEAAQGEPAARAERPAPALAGVEAPPTAPPSDTALVDLAEHLETLARRLRREGEKGVEHALTEGDRLEASLAGFIAGYVAARRG